MNNCAGRPKKKSNSVFICCLDELFLVKGKKNNVFEEEHMCDIL